MVSTQVGWHYPLRLLCSGLTQLSALGREALTLADTLELHKQTSYDSLPLEECSRRIRTLWILMVTER